MDTINLSTALANLDDYVGRAAAGERVLIANDHEATAALIGADDLAKLERSAALAFQLALALGQTREVVEKIAAGELPPAMIGFGLWRDKADLDTLADDVRKNRDMQGSRSAPEL